MATLRDLHHAIGGQLLPADRAPALLTQRLGSVSTDSREIIAGEVFWALRGPRYDGSDFAIEAFRRGAAGAIVSQPVRPPADRWAILVDNTLSSLWRWAATARRHFSGTVIGVTGSVGKTTARQMIHTVLRTRFNGSASPGNFNNQLGVPLSLLQAERGQDYAVLELGASKVGEIASLAGLCAPRIGVITCIGDAHLGGFGSQEGVAQAKTELLAALPTEGLAVLGDDPWLRRMTRDCSAKITWVGTRLDCDLCATNVRTSPGRLAFRLNDQSFQIPVWGRHHLTAALAAIAVGRAFGLDLPAMAEALAEFQSLPMRCEVLQIRDALIINDTYNSSPTAMRAALELLAGLDTPGRRIVACGDMAELGDMAASLHCDIGRQVVTVSNADLLIACGHYARHVVAAARGAGMAAKKTIPCASVEEALPHLGQAIQPGDSVLVKGSRVMAMERVVDALQQYPLRRSA